MIHHHKKNIMGDRRSMRTQRQDITKEDIQQGHPPSNSWKTKILGERSITIILGGISILAVVFAMWALYRSGVSMKRVESMNTTLADLMVKRHESSPISLSKPSPAEPVPIVPDVQTKLPDVVEKSIGELRKKTQDMTRNQMNRKVQFDSIISARQSEISKIADISSVQNHLQESILDMKREKAEAKMEIDSIMNSMIQPTITPQPSFTTQSTFSSINKVQEMESEEVDEDDLMRDLELLNCK